jgi:amidase
MGNAVGLLAQCVTSGPLARSVEDLALVLSLISGPDGVDPHVHPVALNDINEVDLHVLRIAYFIEDGISEIDEAIKNCVEQVVTELKLHVARVVLVQIPCIKNTYRLLWEGIVLGADRGQGTKEALQMLGVEYPSPLLKEFLTYAEKSCLSVTEFQLLFKEIDFYRMEILQLLKDYDAVVSPVAATTAKDHGKTHYESRDFSHCMVHSLSGWPVTVVRCGVSSSGLPIGLQIAAKPWNDHICLALAAKLESLWGGWQPSALVDS